MRVVFDRSSFLERDERIEVFVEDGELKTDHSFTLGGIRFLTLHYDIVRS